MKVLVTGASGQLAKAFIERFTRTGTSFSAPPESVLDITCPDRVENAVEAYHPDIILNCAAYNNVDGAERNPAPAFTVNRDAVGILAGTARRHHVCLVHYSSDYVFDGTAQACYREDAPTAPLNQYGQSKLEGEQQALQAGVEALVLRTSWLYGDGTQNFFHKMLAQRAARNTLHVVWDQISVPTYTEDLVTFTLQALTQGIRGCLHLTNSGYASRYETARFFFKCMRYDGIILPVDSDSFPSPARRPFFSAMDNAKLAGALATAIPAWEDGVERFTRRLRNLERV